MKWAQTVAIAFLSFAFITGPARSDVVVVIPSKDNSIYEDPGGALSNGAGQHLFSGQTAARGGDLLRRALLEFDVASAVPSGSVINSVELQLNVSKVPNTISRQFSIHPITADWGESASNAPGNEGQGAPSTTGDATWIHAFFSFSPWASAGGDFDVTASASVNITGFGFYTWGSTAQMVVDVQSWLDNPSTNYGWIIIGEEGMTASARRFDSREHPTVSVRPQLTIDFTPPVPTGACCDDFSGLCNDNVAEATCSGSGGRFGGDGSICATLDPPCLATGACCDEFDGTCTDAVTEDDCNGVGLRYGGDATTCVSLDPPCEGPDDRIRVSLELVAQGLTSPVVLTHAGDGSGRLFVADQIGLVRVIDETGTLLPTPFLDVSSKMVAISGGYDERGLLGLAFHPDYANNGRFFVRYSAPRPNNGGEPCGSSCHSEVLAEYLVQGDPTTNNIADDTSEVILYESEQPQFNHNAGEVGFGPDGLLYFGLGDGGGAHDGLADVPPSHGPTGHGQNIETDLGTVLRIDVDSTPDPGLNYAVPPTNPFAGGCPGSFPSCVPEIYAYGFRNPYRFSFVDRGGVLDGHMIVGDVGQNLFEEIDVVPLSATPGNLNFGWVIREGFSCFDPFNPTSPPVSCATTGPLSEPLIDPVLDYDHNEGIAVIGGYVYRGSAIPALAGQYVFGDFSQNFGPTGRLFYADVTGVDTLTMGAMKEFYLSPDGDPLGQALFGLGEDESGELYVLASDNIGPNGTDGDVFRIVPATAGVDGISPRYLAITLPPGNDPVGLVVTPACPGSTSRYVGTPSGSDNIALLVDDPADGAFLTPEAWGRRVHVTGVDVGPDALYNVQVDGGSVGAPQLSAVASGSTPTWGDVAGPFVDGQWQLPDGSTTVLDLVSILDTFGGLPTGMPIYRADLIGAGPGGIECIPDQSISVLEVVADLDAFGGISFEDSTPCVESCP